MTKLIASFLFLPLAAQAGIPTTTELTCPIGGERFEITETLSCSSSGERTMSFSPISTCDFVTRLPQCPQNFLPMYKEFSDTELELLRSYMQSESYESSVDRSRFYLAYIVENYLGEGGEGLPFWLLLQGLWFDPDNTFSDEAYMQNFFFEAESEMHRVEDDELPYVKSIVAFANAKAGDSDTAHRLMDEAASLAEIEYLGYYHTGIRACLDNPASEFCEPSTVIPTN